MPNETAPTIQSVPAHEKDRVPFIERYMVPENYAETGYYGYLISYQNGADFSTSSYYDTFEDW